MKEDLDPPKTIEAIGVHISYMRAAQKDTNEALKSLKKTIEDMRDKTVGRIEFDEHVLWGQNSVKNHEDRIIALENENKGVMHQVARTLDKKIVAIIVTLIIGTIGWSVYMTIQYQIALKKMPEVVVNDKG